MKRNLKKGFTLVELVIVIAVIAILSAVLIPTFGNVIGNARDSANQSEVSNAITQYTTNLASQGRQADLPDGYILLLSAKTQIVNGASATPETNNIQVTNVSDNVLAVYEYANGRLEKSTATYATISANTGYYNLNTGTITIGNNSTVTFNGVYVLDYEVSGATLSGKVILLGINS